MHPNGILVQALDDKTSFIKNFPYHGINAYYSFPLIERTDEGSRELTELQLFSERKYESPIVHEFITDSGLFRRYTEKCMQLQIAFRALFIESDYTDEIWSGPLPDRRFLGYEYCPIPIDEQIITDMDWYRGFSKFWPKLNPYGLFDTYEEISQFVAEYNRAFSAHEVGDGPMDAYICRVSQVLSKATGE